MNGAETTRAFDRRDVSLIVVVTEVSGLESCLEAVQRLHPAPREVIVATDGRLDAAAREAVEQIAARLVMLEGHRTAEDVRGAAVAVARGDVVALTESHCVPDPDWLDQLSGGFESGVAAVGGGVEHAAATATLADWAFHFCDYGAFQLPLVDRDADNLTDCNVSYDRRLLVARADRWRSQFHVWTVNTDLRAEGHRLRLVGRAIVRQSRSVSAMDAMRESFAHGGLFAERRLEARAHPRIVYAFGSVLILPLLLGRQAGRVLRHRRHVGRFVASLPWITAYTAAWSLGEALGYWGLAPRSARETPSAA